MVFDATNNGDNQGVQWLIIVVAAYRCCNKYDEMGGIGGDSGKYCLDLGVFLILFNDVKQTTYSF